MEIETYCCLNLTQASSFDMVKQEATGVYLYVANLTSGGRTSRARGQGRWMLLKLCPFCGENLEGERWRKKTL